jgi:DNA polymerase III subunit delta
MAGVRSKGPGFEDLLRRIQKGDYAPVYFLYGPDEFAVQELVKALKEKIASGPMAQFNSDELSGQSLSWASILERVHTLPMMASHRLVIAWNAEKLFKKSEGSLDEAEKYIESPLKETVLVVTAKDVDKRTRLVKLVEKGGGVLFESRHPHPREVPGLVRRFAKHYGKDIDEQAARLLAEMVGTETMWVRNEVDKLCLYVGDKARITEEDVRALLADISSHAVWDLTDALARKDFAVSMRLLEALFRDGEAPPMILGALARQIRMITQVKRLQRARYGGEAIMRALNIRWGGDKLLGFSRGFTEAELTQIYRRLNETDIRLKRSTQPPRLVIENLIADICLA